MSEAVSTVAENVKILPFDKMKDRMTEYVSYQFPGSQPADSESRFMYEAWDLTFGYTYLTAYENGSRMGSAGVVPGTEERLQRSGTDRKR